MLRPVWRRRSNPREGSFLKLGHGEPRAGRSCCACNLLKSRTIRYLHTSMQRGEFSLLFGPTVKLVMRNSEHSRSQSLWGLPSRAFANTARNHCKFNT